MPPETTPPNQFDPQGLVENQAAQRVARTIAEPTASPRRPDLDTLQAIMADHTTVSEHTTDQYLLRGSAKLAFWASVIAEVTEELMQAEADLDVARATVQLDYLDNPPEGKRPTVAAAELRMIVDPRVIAATRAVKIAKRDLEYSKRCFTAIERGGSHVQAVQTRQISELKHLSGSRGDMSQ